MKNASSPLPVDSSPMYSGALLPSFSRSAQVWESGQDYAQCQFDTFDIHNLELECIELNS